MLRLVKLYSDPVLFMPIKFRQGVNIILGEKSDASTIRGRKTNGVGKSLCIEFLDFCLLADSSSSRVLRIPRDKFPADFTVCLDLVAGDKKFTILRRIDAPDTPSFRVDGQETNFRNTDEASRCLSDWIYNGRQVGAIPSFRQLMAPLIRDEKCEFKDIGGYHDTSLRIPADYSVPLFFLGIDLNPYDQARKKVKELKDQGTFLATLKKSLTQNKKRSLAQVQSEINGLKGEVEKISANVEGLKTNESFQIIEQDLVQIENKMELLRTRRKAISYELRRLNQFSKTDEIDDREVIYLYNEFKKGLGDMIAKSLSQVRAFKAKIDDFQNSLLKDRVQSLQDERIQINEQLRWLESEQSQRIAVLDNRGVLADVRTSLAVYHQKSQDLSRLSSQYQDYEEGNRRRKALDAERGKLIVELDTLIANASDNVENFRTTLLNIHDRIMGNKEASFHLGTAGSSKSRQVVQMELRIHDDGSHSVDRTKVFIFDTALMFNQHTRERHPRCLIHDNIFDVDQDTLVQSLNFLDTQEAIDQNFQYVLTLNRDKIENEERQNLIALDIESHKIATFTKAKPFLAFHYQELKKREEQADEVEAQPDDAPE